MNYKAYIKLIRPKHYLKNALILLPLLFSGQLFNIELVKTAALSFLAFSAVASAVYVLNDFKDKELDKLHPRKRSRPIASGDVSTIGAIIVFILFLLLSLTIQYFTNFSWESVGLLGLYLLINIFYSFGLKNVPIIDVAILSLGFIIRVLYGGESVGIEVSKWLYLSVLAFSFYLGLGKRRNEIRSNGIQTRKVSKFYNQAFLDKNMYVCLGLTVTYYSLWAIDPDQPHEHIFWTIPVLLTIVMAYSLAIESDNSDGDPVNVVLSNRYLIALVAFYGVLIIGLIYV